MVATIALLWIHLVVQFVLLPKILVIRGAPKNIDVINGAFWYSVLVCGACASVYQSALQLVQVFVMCGVSFIVIEWFTLPVVYRYWYSGNNPKYALVLCMSQSAHASVLVLVGGFIVN